MIPWPNWTEEEWRIKIAEAEGEDLAKALHYRTTFGPLQISIENQAGSIRYWTDAHTGEDGETEFEYPYGYIRLTHSPSDDEHVDVFIGPNKEAKTAYVITQMKTPDFKEVDEQKCMLGFDSEEEAKAAYLRHYTDPRFFGSMLTLPMDEFVRKVLHTKVHPELIKGQSVNFGVPLWSQPSPAQTAES